MEEKNSQTRKLGGLEQGVEYLMYRSRWLLAPIYLGLSLALVALAIKFFQESYEALRHIFIIKEADLVLKVLTLIDIAMVGGLIVMVMMSGYENFVSKINIADDDEKLGWLGKMDSSSLKSKIAASIVAISSIHLLKAFMNAENKEPEYLMWFVIIHLTFVLSAFSMGYLDYLTAKKDK
jgi:uncharacterized protein (TIGR00645 family)